MSQEKPKSVSEVNANENTSSNVPIFGNTTLEQLTKNGYKTLMETIKHSNALPTGRDWNFYKTDESFNKIIDTEGANVLKLINTVLRHYKIEGNIRSQIIENKTELIVEANDVILERVANNIDEMNGIRKTAIEPVLIQAVSAQLPINGSWNRLTNATFSVSSTIANNANSSDKAIRLLTAKNIVRPQKFFKDKIVNSSSYPWEPRIKDKPNSMKPLAIFLEETERGQEYSHPYELELERFTPLPDHLKVTPPTLPKPVDQTPLIEITTGEQLDELVEALRQVKEFAVDLEHHSYRTFMGITCLMQISTTETDYLIDTLALRDKLCVLNEVFTKPSIVKIFHGADSDVQWLQRDLSLYVVNMFDTHQAAKLLEFSGLSLAYLMKRYCNFLPNKQFQLADWRIRPLPEELKSYAREDTHYLIYIYQMLKKELLEKSYNHDTLIRSVFQCSTEICKKRYFKPVLTEESHLDFYRKCKRLFDNRQLYALKELYKWRDIISREEDESIGYVLPNHMMLQISESLPREMQGILACCNPIPPLVRANLLELHKIILKARSQALEQAIMKEDTRARGTTTKISKINMDSPLHCPHDLTKSSEFRDDLPTLLNNSEFFNLESKLNMCVPIERTTASCSVFDSPPISDEEMEKQNKPKTLKFLGPFERYKLVKPYIQAEEERLTAENAKKAVQPAASTSDGRTDEERIESIRTHFLNLTRQTSSDPPQVQSLVEMGGSKKRKRELSDSDTFHPDSEYSQNQLHTPVPKFHQLNKRKAEELNLDSSPNKHIRLEGEASVSVKERLGPPKGKHAEQTPQKQNNRRNNQKKKNKQNQQQKNQQQQNPQINQRKLQKQNQRNFPQNQRQFQPNARDFHDGPGGFEPNQQFHQGPRDFHDGPGEFFPQRRGTYEQMDGNYSQEFAPFDYSSVDFRQFEGGAGRAQRPQEFKSNFRGRGRKKGGNRGGNKSMTFGKGNRGRGRK